MDIEGLKKFCWKDPLDFHGLSEPFNQGEYTWATDGKTIIGVPLIAGYENTKDTPNIAYLIAATPSIYGAGFLPPEIDKSKKCPEYDEEEGHCYCYECKGVGTVSFANDCHSYTVTCETCEGSCVLPHCPICDGSGIDLNHVVDVNGIKFFAGAILKISSLPNVKIYPTTERAAAHIRFDGGGIGLIMPSINYI